ncbi:MAG: hypothetical protein ACFCUT_05225 [Kiloniellaceae bacterium]
MTSRTDSTAPAIRLRLSRQPVAQAAMAISRAEIERAIARGRALQGEALRSGIRYLFRFLVAGCSLRKLRIPGSQPGRRHACC